ncbi:hypothetical protein OFN32_30810, partial [Escherichia coli]|nr:hypothetical protein [Escherichia coli]
RVQAMQFHAANITVQADGGVSLIERLRRFITLFYETHAHLYEEATAHGGAAMAAYTDSVHTMLDLVPGSYRTDDDFQVVNRSLNLANLGYEM